MVLLACGLARAVEEKTGCIEWVRLYAYIHPHSYNGMYYLVNPQFMAPTWEQDPAGLHRGRFGAGLSQAVLCASCHLVSRQVGTVYRHRPRPPYCIMTCMVVFTMPENADPQLRALVG